MMRIGPFGLLEILVIVAVVAVIFGPAIFVKARKRIKQTGAAAKKGLAAGAKKAGVDLNAVNEDGTKKSAVDHINDFQDKVDSWLDDKPELEVDGTDGQKA